jgi:hypothetical protein
MCALGLFVPPPILGILDLNKERPLRAALECR